MSQLRNTPSLTPAELMPFPRPLAPPLGLQQAQIWALQCSGLTTCPVQWPTPSCLFPRCLQVENEHILKSMKACVSETLSTLGQHFGQLLELALTREVQVSAGGLWRGGRAGELGQAGGNSEVAFYGGHPPQTPE